MTANFFRKILFFKIPIAWIAGIKLEYFSANTCKVKVKLSRWSQNPFKSMFWAVQGMAAEFTTGFLCMDRVEKTGKKISMLLIEQNAKFTKKAVGKIIFTCEEGNKIDEILKDAIETREGKTLWLNSVGKDEKGDVVASFSFKWSFKVKNQSSSK